MELGKMKISFLITSIPDLRGTVRGSKLRFNYTVYIYRELTQLKGPITDHYNSQSIYIKYKSSNP